MNGRVALLALTALATCAIAAVLARRDTIPWNRQNDSCPVVRGPTRATVRLAETPARFVVGDFHPAFIERVRAARLTHTQWAEILSVRVASASTTDPAMAGTYAVDASAVQFRPPFSLVPGIAYRVRFDGKRLAAALSTRAGAPDRCAVTIALIDTTLAIPPPRPTAPTVITALYPLVNVLPMNQLKLYALFSAPMRAGDAAAHIHLIDAMADTSIPDAFFRLEDERWDPTQTRLTILFDPARIKRGLVPNAQLGLPLQAGGRYRLVIDQEWRDANGNPLQSKYEKHFVVTQPDRRAPNPDAWRTRAPRVSTRDTLTLVLDEPMDHALLERLVAVRGPDGRLVDGRVAIGHDDARWHFVPALAWRSGTYAIEVGTAVEDLAGNNLRRLFDADVRDGANPSRDVGELISLRFSVDGSGPHR